VTNVAKSPPPLPFAQRRKAGLWITGIVALVLLAVLGVLDGELQDTGGPGIIEFELAYTSDRAREILEQWGSDGRDAAYVSLILDYVYIVAWALFFSLACVAVAARQWRERWARTGVAVAWLALIAGVCDMVEDAALMATIASDGAQPWPLVGGLFATVKFALIAVAIVYILAGLMAARGGPRPVSAGGPR
jgi:hypothetical protein